MKILAKLIPFTFLLCLVCFGISYIFGIDNLTYLTFNTTNNGMKVYYFDFNAYTQNIDINILKRATSNVIDTTTFNNIVEAWKTIWEDGYNFGDITESVVNGFIMVFNIIILLVNIPLVLLRIASGILLTGLSLLGININNQTGIIIPSLNAILDFGAIDYIQPAIF